MDRRIGRLDQHTVICAYGRVGRAVTDELARQELRLVVVERQEALIPTLEERGLPALPATPPPRRCWSAPASSGPGPWSARSTPTPPTSTSP
jgi:hypothetical protein